MRFIAIHFQWGILVYNINLEPMHVLRCGFPNGGQKSSMNHHY